MSACLLNDDFRDNLHHMMMRYRFLRFTQNLYTFHYGQICAICGFVFIFFFSGIESNLYGQEIDPQNIRVLGISSPVVEQKIKQKLSKLKDTTQIHIILKPWYEQMANEGRLEFNLDSFLAVSGSSWELKFHEGPVYLYESIKLEGLSELYVQKVGIEKLYKKRKTVDWEDIEFRLNACLKLFQKEGHPFASFQRKNLEFSPKGTDTLLINLTYQFDAGSLVTIDSIHISGNHREKDAFVYMLSGVSPGTRYDQDLIDDIPRVLNNSIYYQQIEAPDLQFTASDKAALALKLRRSQAGKFDVLLGILPPNSNDQKLQFTGSADIVLVSPLRYGEVLSLQYNKFTASSSRLDLNLMIPYLLRTPFRLEGGLMIHKQNEDFLNTAFNFSAWYNFSSYLAAKFYIQNKRSSFLGGNGAILDSSLLIQQIGGQRSAVGFGLSYEKLDYRITPTKGLSASLSLALGERALRNNPRIPDELYEGLKPEQKTRELELSLKWYQPIAGRHVLHFANHTYWLEQDHYFVNDLLQVGGAKSIRGFNENEFFTNLYTFFTAAYHLMLEKDSYIFIFGDYAYLQNSVSREHLRPRSFGLGMRYGTKAGIISISYAVGSYGNSNLQPGRGKIHIGLINTF